MHFEARLLLRCGEFISGVAFREARLVVAACAFAIASVSSAEVPGSMPLVASGDGHVWWVVERAPPAASGDASQADMPFLLMHHAVVEPTPSERLVMRFAIQPEALAGEGDALAVVTRARGASSRMVVLMTAAQSTAGGHWYTLPRSGPQVLAPLSSEGQVRDLAMADGMLYALVRSADGAPTSSPRLRLLTLSTRNRSSNWQEISLPILDLNEPIQLLSSDGALALLGSVNARAMIAMRSTAPTVGPPQEWTVAPLEDDRGPLSSRSLVGGFEVDGRLALVSRHPALVDGGPTTLQLSLRRRGTVAAWAAFPEPVGSWAVTGFGSDAVVLSLNAERIGSIRLLPLSAAEPGEPILLAPPTFSAGNWIHIPIIAAAAVALALLALVFGADAYLEQRVGITTTAPQIPLNRRRGARLGHRALAMLVDLIPAVCVVWLFYRGNPLEYLEFPIFVTDLTARFPAILTIALGWLSASIGDIVFGRSIGKRLACLEIISIRGEPSTMGGRALRSLASLVTMAAPPIMLLAAVNPRGDGPAEMVSGTAVVEAAAAPVLPN